MMIVAVLCLLAIVMAMPRIDTDCSECGESLTELLHPLVIDLPDVSEKKGSMHAHVSGLKCGDTVVGSIGLHPKPESSSASFQVSDLQIICRGDVKIKYGFFHYKADMYVHVGRHTGFKIDLGFNYNNDSVMTEIVPQQCHGSVHIDKLKFSNRGFFGNTFDKFVNLFSVPIKNKVADSIQSTLCNPSKGIPHFFTTLQSNVSDIASLVEQFIHIVPSVSFDDEASNRDNLIAVASPLLRLLSKALASKGEDGSPAINKVLKAVQTYAPGYFDGSGNVIIPNWNMSKHLTTNSLFSLDSILRNASFHGLDTFTKFVAFKPVTLEGYENYQLLQFDIALDSLGAKADAELDFSPGAAIEKGSGTIENLSFKGQLNNVSLGLLVGFGGKASDVAELAIGSLVKAPMTCLLSKLEWIDTGLLDIVVQGYDPLEAFGFNGFAPFFNQISVLGDQIYGPIALQTMRGGFSTVMKETLTGFIYDQIEQAHEKGACPLWTPAPEDAGIMDFQQSPIFLLTTVASAALMSDDSPLGISINGIIEKMHLSPLMPLKEPRGFHIVLPSFFKESSGWVAADITVSNLKLDNLDTITQLQMLIPTGPHRLHNEFAIGGENEANALTISADIAVEFLGPHVPTEDDKLSVKLLLSNLDIKFDIDAEMDYTDLGRMSLRDLYDMYTFFKGDMSLVNLDRKSVCWTKPFDSLSVSGLGVSVGNIGIKLECEKCTPVLEALTGSTMNTGHFNAMLLKDVNDLLKKEIPAIEQQLRQKIESTVKQMKVIARKECSAVKAKEAAEDLVVNGAPASTSLNPLTVGFSAIGVVSLIALVVRFARSRKPLSMDGYQPLI